jgi:flavin-dependent dehydrogenase
MNNKIYDVAICGGGLAGLTLARQLKLSLPNLSIIVLDRLSRPLPEAAFKVGESTVEAGSHYLAEILQLRDYFKQKHLQKLGLRFFLGDSQGPFEQRPELGLSRFHAPSSYQVDRGMLENDLRQFNLEMGIKLLENCRVQTIKLTEEPGQLHQITYSQGEDKQSLTIQAHWVIDAMGRRRFLQKQLGLEKACAAKHSAAWFWLKGRFDVSDFVPASETEWHNRVPNNLRYYSTNHLCGKGYWIWLIPLSSDYTSIGIVTDDEVHPFKERHNYPKAFEWLEKHEPILAQHLRGREPEKFMKMPQYTYSSRQVFSNNRWACVGEAGVFPDPFYSPGTDLIGFGNSLVTQMIERDFQGQLTQAMVDEANRFLLTYSDGVKSIIHNVYNCFDREVVLALKVIWDTLSGWAFSAPLLFNDIFLDTEKRTKVRQGSGKFFLLAHRMQQLFRDWANLSQGRLSFQFIDYLELPFVAELRSRNLQANKSEAELIEDHIASLEMLEEFAQVIFRLALEDINPELLADFPESAWLNAWAISLNENRWEIDGLFRPTTKPRDLRPMLAQIRHYLQSKSVTPSKELVAV